VNDAHGHPQTALVLGGASDLGLAVVRRLAQQRLTGVVLAVRDPDTLRARLATEPLGGIQAVVERWDATDDEAHGPLLDRARDELGDVDLVLCAVGVLGHHSGLETGAPEAAASMAANFTGPATALLEVGRFLAAQGHGTIVVLSSVAGVRPRRSNFVYGAAKAGLDAFSRGLADALADTPVRVHVIRPGFVASKMTAGLDPAPFATTPEAVAEAVEGVLGAPRDRVVWVPGLLRVVFGVLRLLPVPLWRRVSGER
jgi:decaprenylphospho-beta-D-erythro-pentofuranosid-2-ulose 2-reductase